MGTYNMAYYCDTCQDDKSRCICKPVVLPKKITNDITDTELRVMKVLFEHEFKSINIQVDVRTFVYGRGDISFEEVIAGVRMGRFMETCIELHLFQARAIIKALNYVEPPKPFDHKEFNESCKHDWNFANDTCMRCGAKYRWK